MTSQIKILMDTQSFFLQRSENH